MPRFLLCHDQMGYPLRFLGDDEPIDIDGTTLPGRMTTEITFRVLHERMLLIPDAEATEIIPAGVGAILRTSPFSIPKKTKKSPAPACHASTPAGRRAFRVAYRGFCQRVRDSTRRLCDARDHACVPTGTITAPVFDADVAKNSTDAPLTFDGGDPRLHFNPFDATALAAFHQQTGPPAE